MPTASHEETLRKLVLLTEPVRRLRHRVEAFKWENDDALITLTRDHLRSAINKYLDGEITAADLEEWADLIECRDEIDFETSHAEEIAGAVENLANPSLFGNLNAERCRNLLDDL